MSTEEFRDLGHWLVDHVATAMEGLNEIPPIREGRAEDFEQLGGPAPTFPTPIAESLSLLGDLVLPNMQHGTHPRYFSRVPGPSSYAGVLGDWMSTGFNAIAASWGGGSGPTAIELATLSWLSEMLGLPAHTEGVMVSGGSIGNLTALATARSAGYHGPVIISDQTHSSVLRSIRLLGWPDADIRIIPTGPEFRWEPEVVAAELQKANKAIVVATAGTTNTGAIDPLEQIAELCHEADAWLHVDGAYGAPAAMTATARPQFLGLERVDSVTLDPHKWLFQPYDLGCVLVTRPGALENCFSMTPEYLKDVSATRPGEVDLRNRGPELSRRARSLKLWLTIRTHGTRRILQAITEGIRLAEYAEHLVRVDPFWRIVTPAQLGILTFTAWAWTDEQHEARAHHLSEGGYAAVSCTELGGRKVFRLCVINPNTTPEDLRATIRLLRMGA